MKDVRTSEEDDTDNQDSNIPLDHGHLARNYSIKIITPPVKALVISCVNIIYCFVSFLLGAVSTRNLTENLINSIQYKVQALDKK